MAVRRRGIADARTGVEDPSRPGPVRLATRAGAALVAALALVAAGCAGGSEGAPQSADAVVDCLDDAGFGDVDQREVSEAESIDALGDAPTVADQFVSAEDSEGRDVYVLLYDSDADAERAVENVNTDGEEAGARGSNLVVFSRGIGPEDRVAIEECFLEEG